MAFKKGPMRPWPCHVWQIIWYPVHRPTCKNVLIFAQSIRPPQLHRTISKAVFIEWKKQQRGMKTNHQLHKQTPWKGTKTFQQFNNDMICQRFICHAIYFHPVRQTEWYRGLSKGLSPLICLQLLNYSGQAGPQFLLISNLLFKNHNQALQEKPRLSGETKD